MSGFIQFGDPENIDLGTKILILYQLEWPTLDFHGGHFVK